jgi:maleate isomerase
MYGYRARIGYISPLLLTEVFTYEFYKVAPPGVTLVLANSAIFEHTEDEVRESLRTARLAARQMAQVGVNLVILGGVPVNLSAGGPSGAEALTAELERECGVPVTSSLAAQMRAMSTLGCRRIGVISPHPPAHASTYRYLEHYGFELVATKSAGAGVRPKDLGGAATQIPMGMARELYAEHPELDTLYFPGPHWAVMAGLEALEQELGVIVVSAAQAIFWDAFRRCGVNDRIAGFGRLLRDF